MHSSKVNRDMRQTLGDSYISLALCAPFFEEEIDRDLKSPTLGV